MILLSQITWFLIKMLHITFQYYHNYIWIVQYL